MKVLELFAGSRSVGNIAEELGMDVFSCDLEAFKSIDYVSNVLDFDVSKVPFIPDIIWASPPCTFFSVASIGHHWNEDHSPKTHEAMLGVRIVKKTLEIINHFLKLNPNLIFFVENPRGKLRKLEFMNKMDRATVWYCQYGDIRAKPTDIWTNNLASLFNPDGWNPKPECFNGNKKCGHEEAPRGSKSGTQGIVGAYDRSKIPPELCHELLKSVSYN